MNIVLAFIAGVAVGVIIASFLKIAGDRSSNVTELVLAVRGALSIADLWAPGENWGEEYADEAMALSEMHSQLSNAVALFEDVK